jgi:hypothetical protein
MRPLKHPIRIAAPMSDWQPGERGVIGLPIVIALQSIGWRSDGTFQTSHTGPRRRRRTLVTAGRA